MYGFPGRVVTLIAAVYREHGVAERSGPSTLLTIAGVLARRWVDGR